MPERILEFAAAVTIELISDRPETFPFAAPLWGGGLFRPLRTQALEISVKRFLAFILPELPEILVPRPAGIPAHIPAGSVPARGKMTAGMAMAAAQAPEKKFGQNEQADGLPIGDHRQAEQCGQSCVP